MSTVRVFVVAHKPDCVINDEVHAPIHVGCAVSKFKEELADMMGG